MTLFEDSVAAKVISAYNSFPGNGKPKENGTSISEFTVLAAIVAKTGVVISDDEAGFNLTIVSMATGTKCAGKGREDKHGYTTSDSHAEVLARRGFVRWLLKCMAALQSCPNLSSDPAFPLYDTNQSLLANGSCNSFSVAPYAVKDNWYFYLYISDSPCGDGTLYPRTIEDNQVVGYTGAKLIRPDIASFSLDPNILILESYRTANRIESENIAHSVSVTTGRGEVGHCSWERENIQDLGVVRTKSGRSDIQLHNRTSSMSCSDKICRWSRLGLQGGMLSSFLRPIYLSGIIVGFDPTASSRADQYNALDRAIRLRLQCCQESQISDIIIKSAVTNSEFLSKTESSGNCSEKEFYSGNIVQKDANEEMINDSNSAECNVDNSRQLFLPFVPEVYITSRHDNPETVFRFSKSNADLINHSSSSNMCCNNVDCGSVVNDDIDSICSSTSKIVNTQENEKQALCGANGIEVNRNVSVTHCNEYSDQVSSQKTVQNNQREKNSKLRIAKRVVPCGTSINWVRDVVSGSKKEIGDAEGDNIESRRKRLKYCGNGTIEVTVADTGALQGVLSLPINAQLSIGSTKASVGQAESTSRLSRRSSSHLFASLIRHFLSGLSESAIKTLLNQQTGRQMPLQTISRNSSTSISQSSNILEDYCSNNNMCSARDSSHESILPISVGFEDLDNCDDHQTSIEIFLRQPYYWWKRLNTVYNNRRCVFLSTGPFKLWLSDDPDTNDQFQLEIPSSITSETNSKKQDFATKLTLEKNRHQHKVSMKLDSDSGQNYTDLNLRPKKKICMNNDSFD